MGEVIEVGEVSARRAATRDRLVDAAITVFAEKGVLGATVEEICEVAGFTRGAFYSNFASKDDLCVGVLDRQLEESLAATRGALASVDEVLGPDMAALIGHAVRAFRAAQKSDRRWVLAQQELRLYAARSPEVGRAYRARTERVSTTIAASLEEALEAAGSELAVGGAEAIGVLHAVHDFAALDALIGSDTIEGDLQVELLAAVLRTLVRPRT